MSLPALGFAHICHRLGITDRSRVWQQKHVRYLIQSHEFPKPLPARSWRVNALGWDRRAVDHWFDERLDRSCLQSAEVEAREAAAGLLDARAQTLAASGIRGSQEQAGQGQAGQGQAGAGA